MTLSLARPLSILVVEDHQDSLQALVAYLRKGGHDVLTACCLQDAAKVLPGAKINVLISDIGLPDGDGWSLMRQVSPPVFAIAMSGLDTEADQQRSEEAGFRAHLVKPLILAGIDDLLAQAAQELAAA